MSAESFKIDKTGSETLVHFPDCPGRFPGQIPLKAIVRVYTLMKPMSQTPVKYLQLILGKLRFLRDLISEYNAGIGNDEIYYSRYVSYQILQVFSVFGFQIPSKSTPIEIPGLTELISAVELIYKDDIACYNQIINEGNRF
jgi:hypothetical protein